MKYITLILSIITFFIPRSTLAKWGQELIIYLAEELVKNTKSKFDDEALEKLKELLNEENN